MSHSVLSAVLTTSFICISILIPRNEARGQIFIPRSPEDVIPRKPEDVVPTIPQSQEGSLPDLPRVPNGPGIIFDIITETPSVGCDPQEDCTDDPYTLLDMLDDAGESVIERYEIRFEDETPGFELEPDDNDEPLEPPNPDIDFGDVGDPGYLGEGPSGNEEAGSGDNYIFYPEF